ncbi:MAG: orotate phosphoribosyltransferase [Rhodospirillales bacterium]|nr:orotate phosphoribosyltransferase [Rhodospirillales bacterium]
MPTTVENARTDGRGAALLARLRDLALVSGREMRLASGRTSNIYFDMKMAMFDPETAGLIADAVLDKLRQRDAHQIGGLEMGAVPIIGAVVCRSYPDYPVNGFFVRKSVKAHGTSKKIEGHFDPAATTVLIEDVTTTGGSVLDALRAVREAGGSAATVLTVVDREEGARANLAAEGVELVALCTRSDFCG